MRCAECHIEHMGGVSLADVDLPLCERCHEELDQQLPETKLGNASDFRDHHPEFRMALITDPALEAPDMVADALKDVIQEGSRKV